MEGNQNRVTKQMYDRIYSRRTENFNNKLKANKYKVMAAPDNRHLVAKIKRYKNLASLLKGGLIVEFAIIQVLVYLYIKCLLNM